jgi:putative phage-type endonuclease
VSKINRNLAIGGSEIGAVVGVDPRCRPWELWAHKKGILPRPEASPRMLLGKALEEGIIRYYGVVTGRKTEFRDKIQQDPDRPWMVGTPDALCIEEERGVDAKLVHWDQRFKWGHTAEEVPDYIQLQCRWYMELLDVPRWDVAALMGENLEVFSFERDRRLGCFLVTKAREFWERYLIGDQEPPMEFSDGARQWLKATFPSQQADIRPATEEEIALLDEYAAVREDFKEAAKERERLEFLLKKAIKDAEGLEWEHGRFTWRLAKGRPDWKKLADVLMKGFAPEEKKGLIGQHMQPGSRKIHFSSDYGEEEDDETARGN